MKKNLMLSVLTAIVIASCQQKKGDWDGNDYYTGKDTVMNGRTYRHSSLGYWYFFHGNNITRYYPNNGVTQVVPAATHRSSVYVKPTTSTKNSSSSSHFSSSKSGFGSTARGGGFHSSGS